MTIQSKTNIDQQFDAIEDMLRQSPTEHVTERARRLRRLLDEVYPQQPEIPALIRRLRDNLGMSQKAFGEAVGSTQTAVNRWEQGACKPVPAKRPAIARLAGCKDWSEFEKGVVSPLKSISTATTLSQKIIEVVKYSVRANGEVPYSKLMGRRGIKGLASTEVCQTLGRLVASGQLVDVNARPVPGPGSVFKLAA